MGHITLLMFCILSMALPGSDAKCPTFCSCDMMAFVTDCHSVNSTARLDQVAENIDIEMEELSFKGNGLTSFDSKFYLKHLTKLDLTGNLLESVPFNLSNQFPSLRTLLLDENLIKGLNVEDFKDLKHVIKLGLTSNRLSTIGDGTFIHMPNLRQLLLTDNQISSVSIGSFKGIKSLVNLQLGKNKISVLPSGIFDNFPNSTSSTMTIQLTSNLLTEIPNGLFDNLASFETFDASNNLITEIGDKSFNNVTASMVSLHNNSISNLKLTAFIGSSIRYMLFDLNPLICECKLRKIAEHFEVLSAKCSNMPSTTLSTATYIASQVCNQCQLNNTCKNDGECIPIGKTGLNCSCVNDYSGQFCEKESVCRSKDSICHNHGVCSPVGERDYKCHCSDDYSGKNCNVFVKQDSGLTSAEIAGIVLGVLFLAFIIAAVYVFRKKIFSPFSRKSKDINRDGNDDDEDGDELLVP